MGSVAAGPLLSRLLNYRTVSFQALRHHARRSAMRVGSGLRAREQSRPLGEDRFPQKSSHGVSGR